LSHEVQKQVIAPFFSFSLNWKKHKVLRILKVPKQARSRVNTTFRKGSIPHFGKPYSTNLLSIPNQIDPKSLLQLFHDKLNHLVTVNQLEPFSMHAPVFLSLHNLLFEFQALFLQNLPLDILELLHFTSLILVKVTAFLGSNRVMISSFSYLLLSFHQNLWVVADLLHIFRYDVKVLKFTTHGHLIVSFLSL